MREGEREKKKEKERKRGRKKREKEKKERETMTMKIESCLFNCRGKGKTPEVRNKAGSNINLRRRQQLLNLVISTRGRWLIITLLWVFIYSLRAGSVDLHKLPILLDACRLAGWLAGWLAVPSIQHMQHMCWGTFNCHIYVSLIIFMAQKCIIVDED